MNSVLKKISYVSIAVLSLAFVLFAVLTGTRPGTATIDKTAPYLIINGHAIQVEVADEQAEWIQGLSDREALGRERGMLFIFPASSQHIFVMRRMHFPLDMIWIDGDTIKGIAENLPPEGENPVERYYSTGLVDKVLEVNGGLSSQLGFKTGDKVEIKLPE